jgi:hypothetical protein
MITGEHFLTLLLGVIWFAMGACWRYMFPKVEVHVHWSEKIALSVLWAASICALLGYRWGYP